MAPPHQRLGGMVQVHTVMECLTADELIRGFAGALVLGEASVEAGAAVAAEAGGFGNSLKLAIN